MKAKINSDVSNDYSILGTFEGEGLDTTITNLNGLDITNEVIEVVLDSEDYEKGIKYGWFIGYLGHPEDPNCMEFERGCIVLTDMHIDDNGVVYTKFNLIDTPVGQIVKKFIDAGVTFGVSIRGAGDIVGNSVDPETFVFRGFDLVAFPAYPNSIPTFTSIAASTNLEDRKKYQDVCATLRTNLDSITSCSTIDVLQKQFAPQSNEYKMLNIQRDKILSGKTLNIDKQKIEAMTNLYIEANNRIAELASENERLKRSNTAILSATKHKISALKRITSSQVTNLSKSLDSQKSDSRKHERILATTCSKLRSENDSLKNSLENERKSNLIYKRKIQANTDSISEKDKIISSLRQKLHKTVVASKEIETATSNLDDDNAKLSKELESCRKKLHDVQTAYAKFYASAIGASIESLTIDDNTSAEDIRHMVASAANTSNIGTNPDYYDDVYEYEDDIADDGIVTL